jgi:hypothetical protein
LPLLVAQLYDLFHSSVHEHKRAKLESDEESKHIEDGVVGNSYLPPFGPHFSVFSLHLVSLLLFGHMNNEGQKFECNKIFDEKRNIRRAE